MELDLAGNNLTGSMPAGVVGLSRLEVLRMGDNPLSGRLPRGLADLPIRELHYAGTEVCVPAAESFGVWLAAVPSHEGTGIVCSAALTDREILEIFFHATGGPGWSESGNWLTNAPLNQWHGVETDAAGRVVELSLGSRWLFQSFGLKGRLPPELGELDKLRTLGLWATELSGPIPPELGNLAELTGLLLYHTDLSGPIPSELGQLANLEVLNLQDNRISGTIPPKLGELGSLRWVVLSGNQLSGSIPSRLGELDKLSWLYLNDNQLSGSIPSGLGRLAYLRGLHLDFNRLSGPVPPAFGEMTYLSRLSLGGNERLRGRLPLALAQLRNLDVLVTSGTGLCAPADAQFQTWLGGLTRRRVAACIETAQPAAYLTQAVQSFEHPVPLVAGRRALLRVFPTASTENSASMPAVRARFYVNGRETRVVDVAGRPGRVPTEIEEGSLANSVNAEIAGQLIRPGLEMVIEVDPDGVMDPSLGVANRIPETGRMAVEVRRMPTLDLTVIPFVWSEMPDSAIMDLVRDMAVAPESHEMLSVTRALLPVGDIEVTAHEPVISSSNSAFDLLRQTAAIRKMEGGTGHYKGMMSPPVTGAGGVAYLAGRISFSQPGAGIVAHELGHNFSLAHAPCGGAGGPRPGVPIPGWHHRRLGLRLRCPGPGASRHAGADVVLRATMDQRLLLRGRSTLPSGRRGCGRLGHCPGSVPAALGRNGRGQRLVPRTRLRGRRPALPAGLRRRSSDLRDGPGRLRALRVRFRHDRDGRWRGTFRIHVPPPRRTGLGGKARGHHALRSGRHRHTGRKQRHPHGHPARPADRASARHPQGRAVPGRGGGATGRGRRIRPRGAVQPRDSGLQGLGALMFCRS